MLSECCFLFPQSSVGVIEDTLLRYRPRLADRDWAYRISGGSRVEARFICEQGGEMRSLNPMSCGDSFCASQNPHDISSE